VRFPLQVWADSEGGDAVPGTGAGCGVSYQAEGKLRLGKLSLAIVHSPAEAGAATAV
jgi:hypothetical protein